MKNLKRIALIVLSVAILLTCFTSCDVLETIPGFENILDMLPGGGEEHVHSFGEATCTAPKTCECGATEGEALGHTFVDGKCVCGETDPNYVPPHEHNFIEGKCECGETDPNYVPPHEHNFVEGKCECGETDPNYVPPHTHNFVEGKCECGETDPNYVPPHTHNFVDGKCECGETDPNYVPPHEHNFVEGKCECGEYDHEHEYEENTIYHPELLAATCCEPGVAVFECTICDYYYTEETPVDPEAHGFWGDEDIITEANCQTQTNGLKKVYCANGCGNYEEVEIFYSEVHAWDVQKEVYATCTEDGEYYAVCTLCGEIEAYGIEAQGHYNWYLTCGDSGECMECGVEFTLEHDTTLSPATCTEAAYCMNCWSYVGDVLPHTYIDGVCECGAEYVAPTLGDWTLVTELKTGDLVIIGAPAYGKLLSAEKVSSYYNKGVDYSIDNFANVTDAEIFVVTVNADGTYTFTSLTGDVLALASSFSSLNKDGEHKSWALTDRGDGTFLLKNTGRGLYLEWYSSKNNWSTYSAGNTAEYYLSFYTRKSTEEVHAHNYISEAHAPTCTAAGYTSYTCHCGDSYTVEGADALGHSYAPVVTAPTCTAAGYTTYTCSVCNDTYTSDETKELGHSFSEGKCTVCGDEDPEYHKHQYNAEVTAPTCTAEGYTTYTCSCGDSYTADKTEKLGHVDANLDIDCDREGCTSKIAPAADTLLSNFTANNLGSKLSTSSCYYVEGTIVEVLDAKNGIFLIDDGTGETFYFRLPKNADNVSHANWEIKLVLGDKVSVYGKINKYSASSAPNGQYWPAMQGPVVTLLEQHPHDFTYQPADCSNPAYCACGKSYGEPLGCLDTDGDDLCDDCGKNVKYVYEYVEIRTDNNSGVRDDAAGTYTWGNDNFDVQVAKGTSSQLYSTSKDHMRVYKGNNLILTNKNGLTVATITVYLTNATQITNFEKFLTGYTYTKNEADLSITIEINSAESITLSNPASTTQIKGVEFGYEKV